MLTVTKKTKKSKHGKKNWRKNINVSDIELSQQKLNQELIKKQKIQNIKDQELFEVDDNDDNKVVKKEKELIGKKTKRIKKVSKNEQRQIKRIIEISDTKAILNNLATDKEKDNNNNNQFYDLWGSNSNENLSKKEGGGKLSYPKVPLPHPGQSYNPMKKDLNKLLKTVVENNKYLAKTEEEDDEIKEAKYFDDEVSEEITKPVANNEPVSDTNRLTRKQKRQKEIKKANKLMNRMQEEQKRLKIQINNALGAKKVEKEIKKKEEELKKKKMEDMKKEKIKEYEIKKGIFQDKELLEDFQVNKEPIPLRKMREEINPLSERWDNIMKRKMIGEYSTHQRKKGNRKLRKIKYMDIDGPVYFDDEEEQQNFNIVE